MHYPLSSNCGVRKLCSEDIIKTLDDARVCVSCGCRHHVCYQCKTTFTDSKSKMCSKNCTHNGLPLNSNACKHTDKGANVSVSKVGSDRSIPLVENLIFGFLLLGIQYDTGCQLSLISKSTLLSIPASMYSLGNSNRVRVLTYTEEGRIFLSS